MKDEAKFFIRPLPPIPTKAQPEGLVDSTLELAVEAPTGNEALQHLQDLPGTWQGSGFNIIWRPHKQTDGDPPKQDRFLELNLTTETLEFSDSIGDIPNRGLLQPDITMNGITYLQKISDFNLNSGIHIEPGIWAVVPATTNPQEPRTVVRMASIPHGTTIVAQGVSKVINSAPTIPDNDIKPFVIGDPNNTIDFVEADLSKPTRFRSVPVQLHGVTQAMVNNPNSVLQTALQDQIIVETIELNVSTEPLPPPVPPIVGGGTSNTAFLQGGAAGPNAVTAEARSTFWIEKVQGQAGGPDFLQLQYTQLVLLNFNGLSWPHVSVATLRKVTTA